MCSDDLVRDESGWARRRLKQRKSAEYQRHESEADVASDFQLWCLQEALKLEEMNLIAGSML